MWILLWFRDMSKSSISKIGDWKLNIHYPHLFIDHLLVTLIVFQNNKGISPWRRSNNCCVNVLQCCAGLENLSTKYKLRNIHYLMQHKRGVVCQPHH